MMANVSFIFFVLLAMTITLYLVIYILMYSAAIRWFYTRPNSQRLPSTYRVPRGMQDMSIVVVVGLLAAVLALVVSFFPLSSLPG
jgi:amino acid transporter